jgi:hypothetical protein
MKLEIMDYESNRKVVEIGDLETIADIIMQIISGDEVATVFYKDNTVAYFDSSNSRCFDYHDGWYHLYDHEANDNWLFSEDFKNRTRSYDMLG